MVHEDRLCPTLARLVQYRRAQVECHQHRGDLAAPTPHHEAHVVPVLGQRERREAVDRVMVVRQRDDRTQIAVLEDGVLVVDERGRILYFNEAVKRIPEVEECHMIAGRFDYLLKIRTKDIRRYRHVLGERISELPFVASTSTNVTMETVVDTWNARSRNA